jgi:hypothetical protein
MTYGRKKEDERSARRDVDRGRQNEKGQSRPREKGKKEGEKKKKGKKGTGRSDPASVPVPDLVHGGCLYFREITKDSLLLLLFSRYYEGDVIIIIIIIIVIHRLSALNGPQGSADG